MKRLNRAVETYTTGELQEIVDSLEWFIDEQPHSEYYDLEKLDKIVKEIHTIANEIERRDNGQ